MRLKLIIFIFVAIIFLNGCATCGRGRGFLNKRNVQDAQLVSNDKASSINLGMTKQQVLKNWGEPQESGKHYLNAWTYSTDMHKNEYEKFQQKTAAKYLIVFENDIVIKIVEYELGEYKFGCSTVDL